MFGTMVAAARKGDRDAILACFDKNSRVCFEELEKLSVGANDGKKHDPGAEMAEALKNARFTYGKEEIRGDTATLEVTKDGDTQTVKFKKEDGAWKVSVPELKMAVEMMKGMGAATEEGAIEKSKRIPYAGY